MIFSNVSTTTEWIAKFGTDIHVPLRMNCMNFNGPLTFHLAPSSGQNFNLSNAFVLPAKLMAFQLASDVLISKC